MDFVIETGITKVTSGRGRKPTAFPLDQMEPGTSFLIPLDPKESKTVESWRRKLRVAVKHFMADKEEGSAKFETAVVVDKDDAEKSGLRVFRTK